MTLRKLSSFHPKTVFLRKPRVSVWAIAGSEFKTAR